MQILNITQACAALASGQIIAYPTEAVFGLGCDPMQEQALLNLIDLKQRDAEKGFILIASEFAQLMPFIEISLISTTRLAEIQATWPGPYTWVFPIQAHTSALLTGGRQTLAVRVSAHPTVQRLCQQYGRCIVSTSANRQQQPPARSTLEIQNQGLVIAGVIEGTVDLEAQPTSIIDAITGARYR